MSLGGGWRPKRKGSKGSALGGVQGQSPWSFLGGPAGDVVVRGEGSEEWLLAGAAIHGEGAAVAEAAAGGKVRGVGYTKLRQGPLCPQATAQTFFINHRGAPMGYSGVIGTFTDLRRQLGWTKNREGRRPRLHDMRHTMAVRTLLRWFQKGADVDQKMLALSTYLGHVEVTDTYWYLTAVPELMALTAARFQAYSRRHPRRGR